MEGTSTCTGASWSQNQSGNATNRLHSPRSCFRELTNSPRTLLTFLVMWCQQRTTNSRSCQDLKLSARLIKALCRRKMSTCPSLERLPSFTFISLDSAFLTDRQQGRPIRTWCPTSPCYAATNNATKTEVWKGVPTWPSLRTSLMWVFSPCTFVF